MEHKQVTTKGRIRYTKALHGFAISEILPIVNMWKRRRESLKPWTVTRYDRRNPLRVPEFVKA